MLMEALAMGGLGLAAALGLGVASRIFAVEVDPRVEEIEEILPGANCGGCGYAGCSAAAAAIVAGKAPPNVCVGGGPEVAQQIAAIMGVEVGFREPEIAKLECTYPLDQADLKYRYDGFTDCMAAVMLAGGPKVCDKGCLGLGSCVKACPFGALSMGADGLPVVNPDKCTGCGTCERVCPKGIIRLTSTTRRILHFNTTDDCLAPCQATCPAQIDIPAYIKAISEGRYTDALIVIKEHNPLPLVCGRVCPHPCEDACRRGQAGDEPVNINHLKRFVADLEYHSGERLPTFCLPPNEKKVAIVGGGPAGLTAAYYLARLGYSPTIFEAQPKLGGMLRYGIPPYRLPRDVLDWEIQGILETGAGVEVRTGVRVGVDIGLEDLRQEGFEAIFLGVGAWASRKLGVDGEELEGVLSGTEFLIKRGLEQETPIGERVVIVGGGNTAIDCARTCWRLGAKEVTILYRRSRAEMPANDYEIEEAEREGIKFIFLGAPTRLIGEGGKLKAVEYVKMRLGEPDASGRRRPEPIPGSEEIIEADNIIAAIGQFPDLAFLEGDEAGKRLEITRWKTIGASGEVGTTTIPWVFAGGDAVHGPATVVEAIGAGRRAARAIHLYLSGEDPTPPPNWVKDPRKDLPQVEVKNIPPAPPRVKMPELSVEERKGNFKEVELGLTEEMARTEAGRCLQCGLICYRRQPQAVESLVCGMEGK